MTVKSDGVDVKQATPEQLATYTRAEAEINAFKVPQLYDAKDPNARVFVALFDGTGNDAIKDPKHITNVGLLKEQLENARLENPNIGFYYKEGPGTQGGIKGTIDGATGGTYQERLEEMYQRFDIQSAAWLQEIPMPRSVSCLLALAVALNRRQASPAWSMKEASRTLTQGRWRPIR